MGRNLVIYICITSTKAKVKKPSLPLSIVGRYHKVCKHITVGTVYMLQHSLNNMQRTTAIYVNIHAERVCVVLLSVIFSAADHCII